MAGGATPSDGSGGKRTFDFQLNLVPFIDLLSVLISFLLMTSIWTQVSKIDARLPGSVPDTIEVQEDAPRPTVLIKAQGYSIQQSGQKKDANDLDTLHQYLLAFSTENPGAKGVSVISEDDVPYESLIQVMDLCIQLGMKDISVGGFDS